MQKSFKYFSILILVSILLSACGSAPSANLAKSSVQRDMNPNIPASDLGTLVGGNNAFAVNLYEALRSRDGNLVFSPYSISLAIAMTYAGARSQTEAQMAKAMQFNLPQDQLHPAFNALDLDLANESKAQGNQGNNGQPMQLNIANSIWAEQTYPFQQAYLDLIAKNYGAGIQLADFIKNFDPVRRQINSWVSNQTKNKINDLLAPGSVDSNTRMVLVNAIYFKADWETPFDANSTSDSTFNLLDGSQSQVKMMNNSELNLAYVKGDGYQAVELPYNGETAAMDIVMPDEGNFKNFESTLDAQKLNDIFSSMQSTPIALGLPKFTFTADFSLSDQLKSLGMTDAFDSRKADFSGMTGNHDLFISDVIHKAFVAVDEKGTEAAAATAVIMVGMSAPLQQKVHLVIDHPFIFMIRDLKSGQILFIGRVLNPAQ
jgi:serpin B